MITKFFPQSRKLSQNFTKSVYMLSFPHALSGNLRFAQNGFPIKEFGNDNHQNSFFTGDVFYKIKYIIFILIYVLALRSSAQAQEYPKRIISLAPNITEIIFKLKAQDRLIGRTEFCLYPEAAQKIPSIGGYLNPDYEKIVELRPDIIFMLPNMEMERKLQNLGLHIFSIPDETTEEVLFSIKAVGKVLGCEQRAEEVIQGIQDTLDLVSRADTLSERASAMLVVGRESGSLKGLYAAGHDTYLSEIWNLCGGANIFADISQRYFSVSKEDLISRNPDFILEFRIISEVEAEQKVPQLISDWSTLPVLNAVENNRIHIFTDRYFLIPGPRISQIAIALSNILKSFHND